MLDIRFLKVIVNKIVFNIIDFNLVFLFLCYIESYKQTTINVEINKKIRRCKSTLELIKKA